jgi:hypothetical protein
VWSQEIARIAVDGVQATISAIGMTDSAAPSSSMKGVRIALGDANGEEHVYVSQEALAANIRALEEISTNAPQFFARHPTGEQMSCFGAGYFWMRPHVAFAASECQTANSRFLAVRGGRDFQFAGLDAHAFADALVRASHELARR